MKNSAYVHNRVLKDMLISFRLMADPNGGGVATAPGAVGQPRTAGDVLNDIGSMLADLTDELDAMLHMERDPPPPPPPQPNPINSNKP